LQLFAPLGVGCNRLVNQRFIASAGALGCLDGVWVISKQVGVNHGVKPT